MVRKQPKAAAKQVRDRLFELTRYPWLDSVSDDRTLWVVRDLVRQRGRTAKIELNIEFQDGTRMVDPVNRAVFEVAVEYVELVRLYQPQMTAKTHREPRPFFVLTLVASWAAGAMVWSARHVSGRQDALRAGLLNGRGRVLVWRGTRRAWLGRTRAIAGSAGRRFRGHQGVAGSRRWRTACSGHRA